MIFRVQFEVLIELEPDFPNGANLSHVGEYLLQTRLDPQKMPPNLTHCNEQCDQMWRNFPTFAKKNLCQFFVGYFVFGQTLNLLWYILLDKFLLVVNGQIWNN